MQQRKTGNIIVTMFMTLSLMVTGVYAKSNAGSGGKGASSSSGRSSSTGRSTSTGKSASTGKSTSNAKSTNTPTENTKTNEERYTVDGTEYTASPNVKGGITVTNALTGIAVGSVPADAVNDIVQKIDDKYAGEQFGSLVTGVEVMHDIHEAAIKDYNSRLVNVDISNFTDNSSRDNSSVNQNLYNNSSYSNPNASSRNLPTSNTSKPRNPAKSNNSLALGLGGVAAIGGFTQDTITGAWSYYFDSVNSVADMATGGALSSTYSGFADARARNYMRGEAIAGVPSAVIGGVTNAIIDPKLALQKTTDYANTSWNNGVAKPFLSGDGYTAGYNFVYGGLALATIATPRAVLGILGTVEKLDGVLGAALQDVRYGPMNPGPLKPKDVATFKSGTYQKVVTQEPETFYRVYGDGVGQLGGFWTKTEPSGPVQSIIDSALDRTWKNPNPATQVVTIKVPAGTTYFEGIAAPQGGLVGGGNQVLSPANFNIDSEWIVGK